MSRISLIVWFEVKPECRALFLKAIGEHAKRTRTDDEGCVGFDVLVPQDPNDGRIYLYETYKNQAALDWHNEHGKIAAIREAYKEWITGRGIHICSVA